MISDSLKPGPDYIEEKEETEDARKLNRRWGNKAKNVLKLSSRVIGRIHCWTLAWEFN